MQKTAALLIIAICITNAVNVESKVKSNLLANAQVGQGPDCSMITSDYAMQCDALAQNWVADSSQFSDSTCAVLVNTFGDNCNNWCGSQGLTCLAAQDNMGQTCNLDGRHDRQSTTNNGCDQNWSNQICVCGGQGGSVSGDHGFSTDDKGLKCALLTGYDKECPNPNWSGDIVMNGYTDDELCSVLVSTNRGNCADYCSSQGFLCYQAQDNFRNTCDTVARRPQDDHSDNGCNQGWKNQICACGMDLDASDDAAANSAYQGGCDYLAATDYDMECDPGSLAWDAAISPQVGPTDAVCSVLVTTQGGNCADFCANQGFECYQAQDNVGRTCNLDPRHGRQDQSDNGCNQNWNNQVCVCGAQR